jgi:hypothetical protein
VSGPRWFIVTAPDGAAKSLSHHAAKAFTVVLGTDRCKLFDCAVYRQAFENLLKRPDPDMVVDLLNQSLAISCLDFRADVCFITALSPVTLFTLRLLRSYGVKTVHWFYEDHRKATYWKDVLDGYDHFFTIQHGPFEAVCHERGVARHFLPAATGCGELEYRETQRPYDAVFIGIPSSYRIAVLEALAHSKVRLAIAGSGWGAYRGPLQQFIVTSAWIDETAAFRIMRQAKIGINLSFDNPSGRGDVHIGPRVYDLLAAGCTLLSEENPLLEESVPDCAMHTFRSIDDAPAAILKLLTNYDHLKPGNDCNRAIVLENHQYTHRVREIVRILGTDDYCSSKNSKG